MPFTIRSGTPEDIPRLAELWQRSVEATHDFLTPQLIAELFCEVRDTYLGAVQVYICEADNRMLGFMGLNPEDPAMVEMLFIEPKASGTGVGTALLALARSQHGPLRVDVNEQNPKALGFYLARGFHVAGRSPLDAQGRPFPLLHLAE